MIPLLQSQVAPGKECFECTYETGRDRHGDVLPERLTARARRQGEVGSNFSVRLQWGWS